jgi:hypothetical protein
MEDRIKVAAERVDSDRAVLGREEIPPDGRVRQIQIWFRHLVE